MKNTLQVIAILLLVSSCGLFKKRFKVKESKELQVIEKTRENSRVEHDSGNVQIAQSHAANLTGDEEILRIEGEGVQITRDGIIRLHKGKIYQKQGHYSKGVLMKGQLHTDWKSQKVKNDKQNKNKIAGQEEQSKLTTKPAVASMLYFLIGLGVLITIVVYWIKKRKVAIPW
jgi:hypothetical protein